MGKSLIIVESPAKIKTLKKFLGKDFIFASSKGHIRDLPQKGFGIDVENDFEPTYVNLPDKESTIKELREEAQKVDMVYLSPDPDREGEAIAWHIASILPKKTPIQRVTFNSITRDAVHEGLKHPRKIDLALVDAQQARRLLDRIVGYKISPILTRKIYRGKNGISAGRVQSVALKLVVDREKEIDNFVPIEYWTVGAVLHKHKHSATTFNAYIHAVNGKRVEKEKLKDEECFLIPDEKTAHSLQHKLEKAIYKVDSIDKKEKKRYPVPPFITSTLQQEASRHYGYNVSRTMSIAQTLYEGVDMGSEGMEGLITYMRTDSVHVVNEAIDAARKYIKKVYGEEFVPETPNDYKSKKTAQEAHEAIRPTNLDHPPESVKKFLTTDQFKIYLLIWKRFIASQMSPALYDTMSVDIKTNQDIVLRATGSTIKYKGFLAVYEEKTDPSDSEEKEMMLPVLTVGEELDKSEILSTQSFTKPPARYTEASLVKQLEKSGIGRPSTYATIMTKIQSRQYTFKENRALRPTELGKIIAQMLEMNFAPIMNIGFTAAMEDDLELIAENKVDWKSLIKAFWHEFIHIVEKAEKEAVVPKVHTDLKCPKCGAFLEKIWSRNSYFYGCSKYPDCDYTASQQELEFKKEDYDEKFDWKQKCPKCGAPTVIRHGRFGTFLGCSKYPECKGIITVPKKGEAVDTKHHPKCPALGCDGKIIPRRSRFGKIFYSCSNFPDCDIIVNNLEDLDKKYDNHHPKTAYQKFTKGAKGSKRAYELSDELAAIVGEKSLPRGDVIKKTWEYIKAHHLQDPKNKRLIIPDAKLAKVFGSKEPIDMMQLSGILSKNFKR
jgi:DNA topoisomerase-1